MPNYSEDEDYFIAVAYTNVTVDPIRGVGQKGENFWMQVNDKFCMFQQKELVESGQHIQVQTKDPVKQRWKKRIAKSVRLWNKHYKQLKGMNKSRWNEEKYVEEASNLYKGETGKLFCFKKCVSVLHKLPKFDPKVIVGATSSPRNVPGDDSSADDNDNNEDVTIVRKKAKLNNDVTPQGSNMQRPAMGMKAKLMKKFEDASEAVAASPFDFLDSNNGSNILANMSNATKDLVEVAFKANASLKRNELRMRIHGKWMKTVTMYMSCQKQDMALMLMLNIQDDDDQAASNSNSPPRTIARATLCLP